MTNRFKNRALAVLCTATLSFGGMPNDTQTDAGGAVSGHLVRPSRHTGSTLIGAVPLPRYMVGNEMDKQKAQQQRDELQRELDRERRRNREYDQDRD